jgi:error-prone DNA polymerase
LFLLNAQGSHGLRVKPINALHSEWNCAIEHAMKDRQDVPSLRIGFRYVRGMRADRCRESSSRSDNAVLWRNRRSDSPRPGASKAGARHLERNRRIQLARKRNAPTKRALAGGTRGAARGPVARRDSRINGVVPALQMTDEERLVADFHGSGMSTGPHPMSYCREALSKLDVKRACNLARIPDGEYTRVAGCVIARQRPGTAKGFVFLSLEDETGISNVIVNPDLYEKYRVVINREKFLRIEGLLQNQDNVISIKASRMMPISIGAEKTESHDFH